MATAQMPYGILGAKSPFQAQLSQGLLQMAQMPGQPAARMAQNMAALQPQTQPAGQMPPPRPPVQAPPTTGALPPEQGPSQATNNALMLGGMAAMKASQPGGSLGTALGEGLAAGTSAFVATKNAEKDKRDRLEIQKQYAAYVQSLGLDPKATAGLTFMGVQAGSELLAKQGLQVPEFTTTTATGGDGAPIAITTNKGTGDVVTKTVGPVKPKEPENAPDSNVQSVMALEHPGKTISQLGPAERADVMAKARTYRRDGGTNVSLTSSPVINAGGDELGSRVVGDLMTRKATFMDQIAPEFASIDRMGQLLKDGIITGPMAEIRAKIAAGTGDPRAQNTLMYIQEVTARVLPIVRTLAPVTEEDVKLLQAAKGGNLYLSAANMKRLGELDKLALAQKAAQYNTTVQRSAILRDEGLAKYRQDAYVTMPDGSVPVRVGDAVHYAQWDPETQSHWYKTKNGRYVEVK